MGINNTEIKIMKIQALLLDRASLKMYENEKQNNGASYIQIIGKIYMSISLH